MGRKSKYIVKLKPFCYYCDKEFNNEFILHQHQKTKHFKCEVCKSRFSTAIAIEKHRIQMHKEKLSKVPYAKSGRDTFDLSIYGMDGMPMELINLKLSEKVEKKKKRLLRDKKLNPEEFRLNESILIEKNNKNSRKNRENEKRGFNNNKETAPPEYTFHKNEFTQFYRNPDSLNITRNNIQNTQINQPMPPMGFNPNFPPPQFNIPQNINLNGLPPHIPPQFQPHNQHQQGLPHSQFSIYPPSNQLNINNFHGGFIHPPQN